MRSRTCWLSPGARSLRGAAVGRCAGLALAFTLAVAGCGDDLPHECTSASCLGGAPPAVELVDDAGNPAAPRGELRSTGPWNALEVAAFDCSRPPSVGGPPPRCDAGGVLTLSNEVRPDWRLELRFALLDGAWSEWRRVLLDISSHTEPEFNGPGCPCTWYSATAEAIVVPAEARLLAP
ncbi:MAG TPA: hypothetical protein VMG12_15115 [Polyangiaceae bacterium]|nr:hypothetical protein [Polyangiaceae bacterium]